MQKYELSMKLRKAMAADPLAVKSALCRIANESFNTAQDLPRGISKFEGGIIVNKRPIVIHTDFVIDDYKAADGATPEEQAVAHAITEVAGIVTSKGVKALKADYGECIYGDPLRRLLDLS